MNKKKKGFFYTRYLQKQIYFRKNTIVNALFTLEKYLFENFEFKEDISTSYIKQKWIYDCINENDFSNEISSQFKVFSKKQLKQRILTLIDSFSQIQNSPETKSFLKAFKKFNDQFNNLLTSESNNNFETNVYFQIYFLIYLKKLKSGKIFDYNIDFKNNLVDIFETIFLEIFIKNKNYKISKIFYLYKILVRLIIKK